jgi:hypothetical protein
LVGTFIDLARKIWDSILNKVPPVDFAMIWGSVMRTGFSTALPDSPREGRNGGLGTDFNDSRNLESDSRFVGTLVDLACKICDLILNEVRSEFIFVPTLCLFGRGSFLRATRRVVSK